MENFIPTKQHLRELLLYFYKIKKNAAESHRLLVNAYGDHALSEASCRKWFQRFQSGDFDVTDKERSGRPKKFEDEELETLLQDDPCQTLEQLSESLNVAISTVSDRLHAIGMIQKQGNWLPHDLSERQQERRKTTCELLLERHSRHGFLHRIVTGDEKWIHYENPKRLKAWVKPGEPTPSTPKREVHGLKVMLSIWWDQKGVLFYELLQPDPKTKKTITGAVYRQQLMRLNRNLQEKRPEWNNRHDKLILLHDNAKSHSAEPVKNYLKTVGWEILPHPPYSPDIAPSDYHLFRSMQSALSEVQFSSLEDIQKWIDEWIASKPEKFYWDGIHQLPGKWSRVVASDGAYFE